MSLGLIILASPADRIRERFYCRQDMKTGQIRQYHLNELLGTGRHGETWLAWDDALQRPVVIKFLLEEMAWDQRFKEWYTARMDRLNRASQPQLATFFCLDTLESRPFVVREYVDGQSLAKYLRERPMAYKPFLDIACQIARGVKAAHNLDVALSNISANNVIIRPNRQVKLVDIGLPWDPDNVSTEPEVVRAAHYRSPEQMMGAPIELSSDLFSIGVLFHECLTQTFPFEGSSQAELVKAMVQGNLDMENGPLSGVPTDARLAIERLLEKKAKDRISAAELLASLEAMLSFHLHEHQHEIEKPVHRRWPFDGTPRQYLSVSILALLLIIFWLVVTSINI
jgi:serine/threonine-protein kinase